MDRARVAEWILRGAVGKEKATSLIGDQIETQPEAAGWRFWGGTIWLLLAISWRNVVALIAAPVLAVFVSVLLGIKIEAPHAILMMESGQQEAMMPMLLLFASLSGLNMLLWGQAVFALTRFGVRDAFFKASLLSALVMTLATSLTWSPHGRAISLLALAVLVGFHLLAPERRAAFGVCVVMLVANWTFGGWLLHLLHGYSLLSGGVALLVVPVVGGATCVWLHQQFLGRRDEVEVA